MSLISQGLPVVILTAILIATCCASTDSETDVSTGATIMDGSELYHEPVEELSYLHGVPEVEVVEILGAPDMEDTLVLRFGETLPEFYIEIHNTYHPDSTGTEGTLIRHLQWEYDGFSKAVFLHRPSENDHWTVLESLRWIDDVDF